MGGQIEAHNHCSAAVWSSGGDASNNISHQIASALDHCLHRIDPQPGERVLDLATGTGWMSRLLARRGADFFAFHDAFATPRGIAVPRECLLTVGTRR